MIQERKGEFNRRLYWSHQVLSNLFKNIFRLCSDVSDGNENEIISENTKLNSGA